MAGERSIMKKVKEVAQKVKSSKKKKNPEITLPRMSAEFTNEEKVALFNFIQIYSTEIDGKKVKVIEKKYPSFRQKTWKGVIQNIRHEKADNQNIYINALSNQNGNLFIDANKGINRDAFIRHLRIAIVHSKIYYAQESEIVELIDYYPPSSDKRGQASAYIRLEKSLLWDIINIFKID